MSIYNFINIFDKMTYKTRMFLKIKNVRNVDLFIKYLIKHWKIDFEIVRLPLIWIICL